MDCPFIVKLPREIRDQIYFYVFASHTGFVTLPDSTDVQWKGCRSLKTPFSIISYDPYHERYFLQPAINLSLHRTRKQVYEECKDIFWQVNALSILQPVDLDSFTLWKPLEAQLSRNLHHVEMAVDMSRSGSFNDAERALNTFAYWSREGSLKKVTLVSISKDSNYSSFGFDRLLIQQSSKRRSRVYEKFLKLLRDSADPERGLSTSVERKIFLSIGFLIKSASDKQVWLGKYLGFDPNSFCEGLHDAFRGELWIDGTLCYKDHVEVKNVFKLTMDDEMTLSAKPIHLFAQEPRPDMIQRTRTNLFV